MDCFCGGSELPQDGIGCDALLLGLEVQSRCLAAMPLAKLMTRG
jgi:hypothetical protein